MLGELMRIGDRVTVQIAKENREWGYNPCPDGAKAKVLGFSEIAYTRILNFGHKPGIYENIIVLDFKSLYPSCMMQFNISPDVFVGNNVEPGPGEIKVGERVCDDGRTTWRTFKNDRDSVLRKILLRLYDKRNETKGVYKSIRKEIDFLKNHLAEM